ncbi:GntR family transcriptional repressor for pyruvate dehydrogenase complex [Virgibacillus natechei]|uniref:GntR family transcriptional repressor for pyruvate dehydrogenase complex n=1 Tax=Virgibacillus natechei TaxID=1216297 RepID=A0ABS4IDA6_9BACI|nr:GntR family transcriptional regulator [Virgibacillus natechei]MBP1968880.1 GntR family transcriptional repressor for pyruvate dehydrogenase complex [Virgibacillus natechei]
MAVSMSPKQKVYQEVLHEIRSFIDNNELKSGDKLPSERELSESLQVGRSSIREALRAMELLGLIETRHGEGTYISTYRPYQTVELLSSFILQENQTQKELMFAKRIVEKEAAKLAFDHLNEKDIEELNAIINASINQYNKHTIFFQYVFKKAGNLLLGKIWQLMEEFSHTINEEYYTEAFYVKLTRIYSKGDYESIEVLFKDVTQMYVEKD